MKNIWFIRTDKDSQKFDVTDQNPFIYSIHGICGNPNYVTKHKDKIFPKLVLNKDELSRLVSLIKDHIIKPDEQGKERCDLAIIYWIDMMTDGDIVFVRNKKQEVLVCKVAGYISETFFDKYGCFQRPVEILGRLTKDSVSEKLWKRTEGRKTIERNANSEIEKMTLNLLEKI